MIWVSAEISGVVLSIENNTYEAKNYLAVLAQSAAPPRSTTVSPLPSPISESFVPSPRPPSRVVPQQTPATILGDRKLNLWPLFGKPGAQITAGILGFPAGAVVSLKWYALDGTLQTIGTINARPQGSATLMIVVPTTETPGTRQVEASASQGPRATALFNVE